MPPIPGRPSFLFDRASCPDVVRRAFRNIRARRVDPLSDVPPPLEARGRWALRHPAYSHVKSGALPVEALRIDPDQVAPPFHGVCGRRSIVAQGGRL